MEIVPCSPATREAWLALRAKMWPESPAGEHRREIARMLAASTKYVAFLALDDGKAVGFAEGSMRYDYVNGCDSSPVAFVEGIYVVPDYRRSGIAGRLCAALEAWARAAGCSEMASDARLENVAAHRMHEAFGFEETERVVYFRKELGES